MHVCVHMCMCVYVCVCVCQCVCLRTYVCMCVYLPLRPLITSGTIWVIQTSHDWLNKFHSYYTAAIIQSALLVGIAL